MYSQSCKKLPESRIKYKTSCRLSCTSVWQRQKRSARRRKKGIKSGHYNHVISFCILASPWLMAHHGIMHIKKVRMRMKSFETKKFTILFFLLHCTVLLLKDLQRTSLLQRKYRDTETARLTRLQRLMMTRQNERGKKDVRQEDGWRIAILKEHF